MRIRFLLVCLIQLVFFGLEPVYSQNVLNWGPSNRIKANSDMYQYLGILGDNYYFVMKPNDQRIVQRYSMDHRLVSEKKFNYVRAKERLRISGSIETSSGSYFYSHQFSRKYKEWLLYVSEIEDGEFTEPREAYFQEMDIEMGRLTRAFKKYEFNYGAVDGGLIMSEDSSKVAFINIIEGNDFKDKDLIAIAVFDDKMQLLWKDMFFYDFARKRYDIEQQVISNDGDIYLVGRKNRFEDRSSKIKTIDEKNLPYYEYFLYNINQKGILESKLELNAETAPTDVALFFPDRSTDQYLIAGFYTDIEHRYRIKGMFFAYGDEDFNKNHLRLHEFDDKFLLGMISEKAIRKGKGLESSYQIKDILNYRDGSIGFVAENSYVRDFRQTDLYGRWYEQSVYVSNELIISRFDPEGNLLGLEKIPKDFSSSYLGFTSYALAVNNGKTYLLFNDFKTGRERRDIDKKGSRYTDLVVIDEYGRIEDVQNLFTDREIDLEFYPNLCDYNQNYFLIGTRRGNRFAMSTLYFK